MRSKEYTINIKPITWARAGKNKTHYYDTQVAEKLAYGLSIARIHNEDPLFEGPLCLDMIFYMKQPKLIRNRKESDWHWTTSDKDNLIKILKDSITQTGIVWHDDRQCSKGSWQAIYDKNPRVYFKITELT